ncbi:MAG: FKBP-type peptidyl-prolyl cis-trans isomerase [Crocinitomicaceae bacterium]|nr:FKBP-type peptidyl-prolyl cis-trans isomerase [Crocinitomicaceae bacterium]
MKYLLLVATAFLFVGCGPSYSDVQKNNFDHEIQQYLNKHNISCEKSPSGLYYKIIEEGEGKKIQFKDHVSFKYRGEFVDGTVFDEQETPVEYKVEALIGAWKEIMLELKKGGKAYLIAPPQLGYGTHDLDDIPANSILIYELEVVDVK